jgi:esterase
LPVLAARYQQMLGAPTGTSFSGQTLFIKGGDSDYIIAEYEATMRQLFPNFEFKMIPGTGHWLHGEKPDVFNALVQRFLLANNE